MLVIAFTMCLLLFPVLHKHNRAVRGAIVPALKLIMPPQGFMRMEEEVLPLTLIYGLTQSAQAVAERARRSVRHGLMG